MDRPIEELAQAPAGIVSMNALFVSFLKLGTVSFGGGTSGWTYREIVENRHWLDEEEFLNTLTIAQVLAGANPVNLAVYIGLRLRGITGACVAFIGMLLPAFLLILLISIGYQQLSAYPEARDVLRGLACVGIASLAAMGLKTARRLRARWVASAIAAAIFVLVGIFNLPLIPVVAVSVPLGILNAFFIERKDDGR